MSKEVKVGLMVAISVLIFFAGFYYLKGSSLVSGQKTYYSFFDNVQGLTPSSFVVVKGVNVGKIKSIELNTDELGNPTIKVAMAVDKNIQIPEGTVAKIISTDLLGAKVMGLELGTRSEQIADGGTIPGEVVSGLMDNVSSEITPLLKNVRSVVTSLDTVVNNVLNPASQKQLANAIASLEATMKNFESLSKKLNAEGDALAGVINNANSITGNLAKSNEKITNILNNAEQLTDKLAAAPIDQTLIKLNKGVDDLQSLLNKINSGQGSIGMLVNDKDLYNNLTTTLSSLDKLVSDLKAHPSRYINVSVFGKKNNGTSSEK